MCPAPRSLRAPSRRTVSAAISRHSPRQNGEDGFTLVELLVVIAILGILSGVVVFAVRGVKDKGKTAAVAVDDRILRTAEEAYCASRGEYADMGDVGQPGTLVGEGFLSAPAEYHDVVASKPQPPDPPGPCNGWKYDITETAAAAIEKVGCLATPDNWKSATWCLDGSPPGNVGGGTGGESPTAMVLLADGTAFAPQVRTAGDATGAARYTPATGVWEARAPVDPDPYVVTSAVLLNDGKVLAHILGYPEKWGIYDPAANTWTFLPSTGRASEYAQMVKLSNGKVLIGGESSVMPCLTLACHETAARLYDPGSGFSLVFYGEHLKAPVLAPLPNGDVLLVSTIEPDPARPAINLDSRALTFNGTSFSSVNAPPHTWTGKTGSAVLAGGKVIVSGAGSLMDIYDPVQRQWSTAPSCATATAANCQILAVLPDGSVMAKTSTATSRDPNSNSGEVFLFKNGAWTKAANLPDQASAFGGVTLAGGACDKRCGKVLVAGNGKAATYTP